jgi:hypothetical protein
MRAATATVWLLGLIPAGRMPSMKTIAIVAALALATAASAQTCAFRLFGRPCGGDLAGQQVTTPTASGIRFDAANLAPGAVAILVFGQQPSQGIQLPGSNCLLLVQPGSTVVAQADRTGSCTFRFPIPTRLPVAADFQVVTIGFTRNGRIAESTNGVSLACR